MTMTTPGAPQKILIIDDDVCVLKLLRTLLTTHGYEVLSADEAPAGLELAMKARPDLIVLDVMMPIINGFNICRLSKSEEGVRDIPVMLLTSRVEDEDQRIGQEVGADAYLAKPLENRLLLYRVQDLLGSQAGPCVRHVRSEERCVGNECRSRL